MATKLQIANGALIKLGGRTISSLAGTDKESRLCNERIDQVRKAVLRLYPWPFARDRRVLTTLSTTPVFGFENAFVLPTTFLRVVQVNEGDENWRIENGEILSDAAEVRLSFVRDYDLTDFPDPLFCEVMSCYLAWDIAYALTQSADMQDRMWLLFTKVMPVAKHVSATESSAPIVEANDWVDSRMNRGRFVRDPGT